MDETTQTVTEAATQEPPKDTPIQIRPRLAVNTKGEWIKESSEDCISYIRKDGLGSIDSVEGDEGFVATVPSTETCKEGILGPFNTLKAAKNRVQNYLHKAGFIYYRSDMIKMRKDFIQKMIKGEV